MVGSERHGGRCDLLLEGGGIKAIALAGACAVIEERGFEPRNVAGTSAGALVAALLAAGYSARHITDLVFATNFAELRDRGWEDRLPLVRRTFAVLKDLGVYEGNALEEWTRELLDRQGIRTFGDLMGEAGGGDWRRRFRLQVAVTDVTSRRLLLLPRDAGELGLDPEALEVAHAVRMSMSIPVFFEPVCVVNERTGREHVIADGGMLSNFPVWLFDSEDSRPPAHPTFGLLLVEPDPKVPIGERRPAPDDARRGAGDFVRYAKAMADMIMEAHDRLYVTDADFARTIPIPALGVAATAFDLTHERKTALYQAGRDAAERFLDSWSFPAYVAAFRTGEQPGRRRALQEQIRRAGEGPREAGVTRPQTSG